jgi:hypothetical protein
MGSCQASLDALMLQHARHDVRRVPRSCKAATLSRSGNREITPAGRIYRHEAFDVFQS